MAVDSGSCTALARTRWCRMEYSRRETPVGLKSSPSRPGPQRSHRARSDRWRSAIASCCRSGPRSPPRAAAPLPVDEAAEASPLRPRARRSESARVGLLEAPATDQVNFARGIAGPQHRHYRLFCLLERDGEAAGLRGPSIIVLAGMAKDFR